MTEKISDTYSYPKIELDSDEVLSYIANESYDKAVSDAMFRFRCKALIALWCEGVGGLFEVLNDYTIE